jgi:hypothetical protein
MINYVYIKIPASDFGLFENLFHGKRANEYKIHSAGHSWNYPTKIKGWQDWDYPQQIPNIFRDVATFKLSPNDVFITTIRNPFNILVDYYKENWANLKTHYNLADINSVDDFQKFVDIYLNKSIVFHAPAFRNSMFSQLKDINGNWLFDDNSIIIRSEYINEDLAKFSETINLPISLEFTQPKVDNVITYRDDQIERLTKLWKSDLDYFGYSFNKSEMNTKKQTNSLHKPKIALCFSGEIRDLDRTKEYWGELIKKYDIDVYGSFWDTYNTECGDTIENFHRIYNVKKVEVENYNSFNESTLSILRIGIEPPTSLLYFLRDSCVNFGTMSMWYKIWRANLLTKDLGIDYDIVIRARTDTYFDDNLDISINDMLNLPHGRVRLNNHDKSEGISDLFAYGSPKMMDYYSTCYFFIMNYLTEGYYLVPHEHMLHIHMNKINVPIRFMVNNITITRTSRGTEDEVYCNGVDINEEILQSDFMELEPQKDLFYKANIKEKFKI